MWSNAVPRPVCKPATTHTRVEDPGQDEHLLVPNSLLALCLVPVVLSHALDRGGSPPPTPFFHFFKAVGTSRGRRDVTK